MHLRRRTRLIVTSDVETYYRDGAWHNRSAGTICPLDSHATRSVAEAIGRTLAIGRSAQPGARGQCEHIVRNLDDSIGNRRTYPRSKDVRHAGQYPPI
jgi:hypothetical protein